MMFGPEYFTNAGNDDSPSRILKGFGSKKWTDLREQQALLIDITVTVINALEPIVGEYNGFSQKRKSKSWFELHQDEVFLSFFCAVTDIMRAWHHVDDGFDKQIRDRFPVSHNDFYIRNWKTSNDDLHFRNFHSRIGNAWHQSLAQSGIQVKEPSPVFGVAHFAAYMHSIMGYLEFVGQYGIELKPSTLIAYFAE
jgi:hypothetical protein